jgi:hypothetical protein
MDLLLTHLGEAQQWLELFDKGAPLSDSYQRQALINLDWAIEELRDEKAAGLLPELTDGPCKRCVHREVGKLLEQDWRDEKAASDPLPEPSLSVSRRRIRAASNA